MSTGSVPGETPGGQGLSYHGYCQPLIGRGACQSNDGRLLSGLRDPDSKCSVRRVAIPRNIEFGASRLRLLQLSASAAGVCSGLSLQLPSIDVRMRLTVRHIGYRSVVFTEVVYKLYC